MHAICRKLGSLAFAGAVFVVHSRAMPVQTLVSDEAIVQEFGVLSRDASLIFVGQIVTIQRSSGFVHVTFRVEQPVSGLTGSSYTMREWAGLWPPGTVRYTVGQRVLAFLHAPSAAGASSPVHGAEGLVPVVVQGANAPELVDIRRVAASLERVPGTALPGTDSGAMLLSEVLASFQQGARVPRPSGRVAVPLHAQLPMAMQPASGWRTPSAAAGTSMQSFHPSSTGEHIHAAR